jgi:DNA-binding response OmpR family regulator
LLTRAMDRHCHGTLQLDRELPGMSGGDVCRVVRARGLSTRVLLLSASVFEADRAMGLAPGARDHITKLFAFAELVQRVRTLGEDHPAA